jgi:YVTN family beta-propeller protein
MHAGRIGWARASRVLLLLAAPFLILVAVLRPHESRSSTNTTPDFRNFETLQVHPLAITPDGSKLLALNTPDARLEVFAIGPGSLDVLGEVSVGLDPVSVSAQDDSTAWVVNQLSDDVSVVDLRTFSVKATVRVGDEPSDVVFAGSPRRAFVCVSGEDAVKTFDLATLVPALAPIPIFGRHPHALAAGGGGSQVYVTILEAGNRTTIVRATSVSALGGPSPPNPPKDSALPPAPAVGVVVQWNGSHWIDDGQPAPKTWDAGVPAGFALPDVDVAVINANTGAVSGSVSDLGTNNFNIAIDPTSATLYVTNTDASNRTRFEPNLKGRFLKNQVTLVGSGGAGPVTPVHLNSHINYGSSPGPQSERDLSLAEPIDIAVNVAAGKVYVAAMGSSKVGVLSLAGNVTNRIATGGAPAAPGIAPGDQRGPTGLALDQPGHQLFVLNRFTNSIAILDTDTETKIGEVALRFDPSPPEVRNGRPFLYDGNLSAHGDLACGSCHIGGNLDNIAWDLGNPLGQMEPSLQLAGRQVHPMKGPMTTQSLRGLADTSPFHWRADRLDFTRFNPAFINLMGAPDSLSPADMQNYSDFIMTVAYPPNPNQKLNRGFTALADSGRVEFESRPHDGGQTCAFCHSLPTGTDRIIIPGVLLQESQDFKVPQLRNMHQKTGFTLAAGAQKRGYGFLHDGSVDNLVNFLRAPVFNFPDTTVRYEIEAFLLSFDTGTAPSVGRELTINAATKNSPGTAALLDSLYFQADLGNCDLIAHGRIGGVMKGFLYQPGHTFISDLNSEGTVPADTLRSWASAGGEITYMGVPPNSGMRMALDRDRDGYRDRWELALGSNPADPLSTPVVTAVDGSDVPRVARVDQNRPNPFNPETVIPYDAGPGGRVSLRVFDTSGRMVRTLVDAVLPTGAYRARWNGRNDRGGAVASGRYFYRLTVGKTIRTRAMTLLR